MKEGGGGVLCRPRNEIRADREAQVPGEKLNHSKKLEPMERKKTVFQPIGSLHNLR